MTTRAQWEGKTLLPCLWRFSYCWFYSWATEWYLLYRIFFLQRLFLLVISPLAVERFTDEKRKSNWALKVTDHLRAFISIHLMQSFNVYLLFHLGICFQPKPKKDKLSKQIQQMLSNKLHVWPNKMFSPLQDTSMGQK